MILVFITCATEPEAQKIGETLVEQNLAACAHIMPPHQSIYRWQGKIERATEYNLLVKTQSHHFEQIRKTAQQLHSYEVPAIFSVPVTHVSNPYLNWLVEQTS
jgi:periplasmic divalent cation tolerance protein